MTSEAQGYVSLAGPLTRLPVGDYLPRQPTPPTSRSFRSADAARPACGFRSYTQAILAAQPRRSRR